MLQTCSLSTCNMVPPCSIRTPNMYPMRTKIIKTYSSTFFWDEYYILFMYIIVNTIDSFHGVTNVEILRKCANNSMHWTIYVSSETPKLTDGQTNRWTEWQCHFLKYCYLGFIWTHMFTGCFNTCAHKYVYMNVYKHTLWLKKKL